VKHQTQYTSLASYFGEVLDTLGSRQKKVLEAFTQKENFTNTEVADFLQMPINTITPRTNELVKKGLLREACVRECKITSRKAKAWEIKPQHEEIKSEQDALIPLGI